MTFAQVSNGVAEHPSLTRMLKHQLAKGRPQEMKKGIDQFRVELAHNGTTPILPLEPVQNSAFRASPDFGRWPLEIGPGNKSTLLCRSAVVSQTSRSTFHGPRAYLPPSLCQVICLANALNPAFHVFYKSIKISILHTLSGLIRFNPAQKFFPSAAPPQMNSLCPQSVELYMTRYRNSVS